MSETIIAVVITAICGIITTIISSVMSNSKTVWRLQELERKVENLSGIVERLIVVERDLKTAFNQLAELRGDVDELRRMEDDRK